MHFEGRRRSAPSPNLTPLIDVVFLLLIFFMLTSHFVREEVIALDLPTAASSAPMAPDTEPLQLVLDSQGRILLGGDPLAPAELEARLARELAGRSDKSVQIRGDRGASLGMMVQVLDAARQAGTESIDIVTREP